MVNFITRATMAHAHSLTQATDKASCQAREKMKDQQPLRKYIS